VPCPLATYGEGFTTLRRPVFGGDEKAHLADCIDSDFVSSVGAKICEFERRIAEFTGSKYAVAKVLANPPPRGRASLTHRSRVLP